MHERGNTIGVKGVMLFGLRKVTLGEGGWGVAGGESMLWSFVMVSKVCCPLRLVVPLRVAMRSWTALTIASAGVTVGCVMYLCLKNTVSNRQLEHMALTKMRYV